MNIKKIFEYGRIVCAAILKDDCIYMTYEGHHEIFPMESIGILKTATQGFVTENGYFVDRVTVLEIAKYYEQIYHKFPPNYSLNSEDLAIDNVLTLKKMRKEYKYKLKSN